MSWTNAPSVYPEYWGQVENTDVTTYYAAFQSRDPPAVAGSIGANEPWIIATAAPPSEPSALWASAVSGNWSDSSKWTGGVPNAVGAVAVISASTTTALTVTLDAPQTVGTLLLGSGNLGVGYTVSGSGSNALTFSNTSNSTAATISVIDGTHVINAPVVLASNLVVTSTSSNPWTLSFGPASSITDNGNNLSLTIAPATARWSSAAAIPTPAALS